MQPSLTEGQRVHLSIKIDQLLNSQIMREGKNSKSVRIRLKENRAKFVFQQAMLHVVGALCAAVGQAAGR